MVIISAFGELGYFGIKVKFYLARCARPVLGYQQLNGIVSLLWVRPKECHNIGVLLYRSRIP